MATIAAQTDFMCCLIERLGVSVTNMKKRFRDLRAHLFKPNEPATVESLLEKLEVHYQRCQFQLQNVSPQHRLKHFHKMVSAAVSPALGGTPVIGGTGATARCSADETVQILSALPGMTEAASVLTMACEGTEATADAQHGQVRASPAPRARPPSAHCPALAGVGTKWNQEQVSEPSARSVGTK
jgi:hypothetical protein